MQHKAAKMSKRVGHRAWELLRELLCARKGELCRNRVALTLNVFHKLVRKIAANESRTALLYGDHELSFQSTPLVHVRMHRAPSALRFNLPRINIPCITPHQLDFDWREAEAEAEMSDEGIDERAEEFIANFYKEMKQQRQISCL